MGVISSLGMTLDQLWSACEHGMSGVGSFSLSSGKSPVSYAARTNEFTGHISNFGELDEQHKKTIRKGLKLMSREIQMGVASAQRALIDANIQSGSVSSSRVGVSFASDYIITTPDEVLDGMNACQRDKKFDFSLWAEHGMTKMTPIWQLKFLTNMPASHIAIYNEFFGPSNAINNREASFGAALGEAVDIIRAGRADVMVVGATGSRVLPFNLIHYIQQDRMAVPEDGETPESLCRPFDLSRKGSIPGDGAGTVIIESAEHAMKRGVPIYAEVLGGTCRCTLCYDRSGKTESMPFQTSDFDTSPSNMKKSIISTLRSLLRKCGYQGEKIGHINAQAGGDRLYDAAEAQAIREVFGSEADSIPVTSLKGNLGNPGAGGGAIELIASVLAMKNNALFPILNNRTDDPDCPISPVRKFGQASGDLFLKICAQKIGQSSAVLVRRWSEQ